MKTLLILLTLLVGCPTVRIVVKDFPTSKERRSTSPDSISVQPVAPQPTQPKQPISPRLRPGERTAKEIRESGGPTPTEVRKYLDNHNGSAPPKSWYPKGDPWYNPTVKEMEEWGMLYDEPTIGNGG